METLWRTLLWRYGNVVTYVIVTLRCSLIIQLIVIIASLSVKCNIPYALRCLSSKPHATGSSGWRNVASWFRINEHQVAREKAAHDDLLEAAELRRLADEYGIERERLDALAAEETKLAKRENRQQLKDIEHLRSIHAQMDEVRQVDQRIETG